MEDLSLISQQTSNDIEGPLATVDGQLEFLSKLKADSFESRAYGCILGAFIGDSCGSFLKSSKGPV